jgi:hypothetical protein
MYSGTKENPYLDPDDTTGLEILTVEPFCRAVTLSKSPSLEYHEKPASILGHIQMYSSGISLKRVRWTRSLILTIGVNPNGAKRYFPDSSPTNTHAWFEFWKLDQADLEKAGLASSVQHLDLALDADCQKQLLEGNKRDWSDLIRIVRGFVDQAFASNITLQTSLASLTHSIEFTLTHSAQHYFSKQDLQRNLEPIYAALKPQNQPHPLDKRILDEPGSSSISTVPDLRQPVLCTIKWELTELFSHLGVETTDLSGMSKMTVICADDLNVERSQAYAGPCDDYIKLVWGDRGVSLFEQVKSCIETNTPRCESFLFGCT